MFTMIIDSDRPIQVIIPPELIHREINNNLYTGR
jgi:hypothetical protein